MELGDKGTFSGNQKMEYDKKYRLDSKPQYLNVLRDLILDFLERYHSHITVSERKTALKTQL